MAELFEIDRFMDASGKVDLSDIDWTEVPKYPMTPEALRTLRYFMTTESSTFFYVKALMKTKAAILEPDLAPFLCVCMYEEDFHGRAFRKFMEAYGEKVPADYRATMFNSRGIVKRIDEIGQTVLSRVFPDGWPAVHMIWGVVQEFTTYNGYIALIERTGHPILATICQRIMKQEMKHFAFYRDQAYKRLVNNPAAQRLTSEALKIGWTPVGEGMCSKEDVHHAQYPIGPVGVPTESHLFFNQMVMKYTKYPQAAKEFLRFMMEQEQFDPWLTAAGGYVAPPLADYAKASIWTSDPKHTPYRDCVKNLRPAGYAGKLGYASAGAAADFIVTNMVAEAASGSKTPKEAAERAQKRAERYYKV